MNVHWVQSKIETLWELQPSDACVRRNYGPLFCLLYKLYNGQRPPSLTGLFQQPFKLEQKQSFGHPTRFTFHLPRTFSRYLLSFLCFSIGLWNNLPASAISQSHSVRLSGLSFTPSTKQISFIFGLYLSVLN